ncbi:MAG: DUF4859 domain-containing protein [Breznakibacter sp.]
MKKMYLYIAFLSLLVTGFAGCGDNEDFSSAHVLTDEEQAELDRQDSIRNAQLNNLNVDLKLEYTVDITISSTLYDGTTLEIDLDKIATFFGITKEELLAGIAGETGAPEVKGFAIEGSTHADNSKATTTNAPWGHWWDAKGDVTTWGETAMIFCEFDTETGIFSIGQYPGRLTAGQTLEVAECLKYNEERVGIVIKVNAKAPEEYNDPETPPAGDPKAVETAIALTKPYSDDYASVSVDIKELLRDAFKKTTYQIYQAIVAGELKLYQGTVSETDPGYTADVPGYWLKADGTVGTWTESVVWCSIGYSKTELYLYGGNHPDNATAGTTINTVLIATYNGGSATFNVTFSLTQP